MSTRLYVVRHGETTHNRDDITSGHVNPELTEYGKKQAHQAKIRLQGVVFDEVYSSDLQRAYETAAIIYGNPVPEKHRLPELRERNFGSLEGRPSEHRHSIMLEHEKEHGPLSHSDSWVFKPVPNMESDAEMSARFIKALSNIATKHKNKTVLVAAHGGTVRTMLIGLGHGTAADFPAGSIRNASFVCLEYDGNGLRVTDASDAVSKPLPKQG